LKGPIKIIRSAVRFFRKSRFPMLTRSVYSEKLFCRSNFLDRNHRLKYTERGTVTVAAHCTVGSKTDCTLIVLWNSFPKCFCWQHQRKTKRKRKSKIKTIEIIFWLSFFLSLFIYLFRFFWIFFKLLPAKIEKKITKEVMWHQFCDLRCNANFHSIAKTTLIQKEFNLKIVRGKNPDTNQNKKKTVKKIS